MSQNYLCFLQRQILHSETWLCVGLSCVAYHCWSLQERKALASFTGSPPRVWLRYVDDTFVVIKGQELQSFFEHLNGIDSNIKFTQEKSQNNSMPFLDCLITIKNNRLQTKVYRKPTHTDQYLAFDSNHPLIHKLGVIRTLQHRANTVISQPSDIIEEHRFIKEALRHNGYPDWAFHKVDQHSRRPPRDTNTRSIRSRSCQVIIPYIQGPRHFWETTESF